MLTGAIKNISSDRQSRYENNKFHKSARTIDLQRGEQIRHMRLWINVWSLERNIAENWIYEFLQGVRSMPSVQPLERSVDDV